MPELAAELAAEAPGESAGEDVAVAVRDLPRWELTRELGLLDLGVSSNASSTMPTLPCRVSATVLRE